MQRRISSFSWIFAFFILALSSCSIETAQPIKSQALVIASDFLHPEDTVLFKDFIKKNDVRIVILHLSPDQMISEIHNKGYNSGIDMVLSQNMHTPIELNKLGLLQDLIEEKSEIKSQNRYISYKHNFIGIGLDPFVFKYTTDSLRTIRNYRDLIDSPHYNTLTDSDLLSFLSPMRRESNRAKTYDWTQKWLSKSTFRPEKGPWKDSANVVLCKYSQLESFEDSVWQHYPEGHYFPNEDKGGVYYDVMSLSIVRQAENYSNTQKFLAHCQNSGYNAGLNNALKRFPIYDYLKARSEGPKFYPVHIDQLLQYQDVLERMLKKIKRLKTQVDIDSTIVLPS